MAGVEQTTFCRVCEAYCGVTVTVEDGRIVRIRPDDDHVASRGYSCPKGLAFHEVVHDPDRVLHPSKKTADGGRVRISWEQAIAEIGARLRAVRERHGPQAIATYVGNPAGYSYSHVLYARGFADAVGTTNTYGAGSQDNLADFVAAKFLYGAHVLQPIPDLARTRFLFVVASNPAVSHGTLMSAPNVRTMLRDVRARGGKIVVVDPRRTETAALADEHHFIRPDSDAFLLLAMTHVILAEGLEDTGFLAAHATGVEWLRAAVGPFTPELAAARTGIDAGTVRRLAREFAAADGACSYGRVVCGRFGTLAAWSLDLLNVVTGNLDAPGGAVFPGGIIDSVAATVMAGADERGKRRSRLGDHPAVLGELPAGLLADEITTPGDGQVRALVVTAGNPVLSTANGSALAAAMAQLECSVVVDFYLSETAVHADYVLPCTTFFEREDLPIFHANLMQEPYVQWTEAVLPPQGEAKPEWDIFSRLVEAMGLPPLGSRVFAVVRSVARLLGWDIRPRTLMDAMIRLGPYGDKFLPWRDGLSLARLADHPHGLRLGAIRTGVLDEKLRTPDKRVHLENGEIARELRRLREDVPADDAAYPFRLIGRRDQRSNNSWLHNVPKLMRGDRCNRLRMHPGDAARLGIGDGDTVRVRSRVGAVEVPVRITDEVMPGVLSLPHGWGHQGQSSRRVASETPGVSYNDLIDHRAIEPLAGMAFLNGFPVAVQRLS